MRSRGELSATTGLKPIFGAPNAALEGPLFHGGTNSPDPTKAGGLKIPKKASDVP
jgi:hypothetical protein